MLPPRKPAPKQPTPKPSNEDAARFAQDSLQSWNNEQDRIEAEAAKKK
jgi:hypothetical protein